MAAFTSKIAAGLFILDMAAASCAAKERDFGTGGAGGAGGAGSASTSTSSSASSMCDPNYKCALAVFSPGGVGDPTMLCFGTVSEMLYKAYHDCACTGCVMCCNSTVCAAKYTPADGVCDMCMQVMCKMESDNCANDF